MEEEARLSEERRMKALAALQETLQSQETAEQKLANVKHLMAADMSTLREVTTPDMKKERMIGIVTGVAGSLIAGVIGWFFTGGWKWFVTAFDQVRGMINA
ncbi:hypothetical protein D3C85_1226160 [compost metagenome]